MIRDRRLGGEQHEARQQQVPPQRLAFFDLFARSLRECPPDFATLRASLGCPVLESSVPDEIEAFATSPLP